MATTDFASLGDDLWNAASALEDSTCRMASIEHILHLIYEDLANNVSRNGVSVDRAMTSIAALSTVSTIMFEERGRLDHQKHAVYDIARAAKYAAEADEARRRDIDARR